MAALNLDVQLAVNRGVLNLETTTGLSVTGNGTNSVVLSGSIDNLNASLASLVYQPRVDFNRFAGLTITVNDGFEDFEDTVALLITEVNDAPVGVNDSLSSISEDSGTRTISFASLLANDSVGPLNEGDFFGLRVSQTLTITSVGRR